MPRPPKGEGRGRGPYLTTADKVPRGLIICCAGEDCKFEASIGAHNWQFRDSRPYCGRCESDSDDDEEESCWDSLTEEEKAASMPHIALIMAIRAQNGTL